VPDAEADGVRRREIAMVARNDSNEQQNIERYE
jgi:hypothetical protein